jgi:hypothetical protein
MSRADVRRVTCAAPTVGEGKPEVLDFGVRVKRFKKVMTFLAKHDAGNKLCLFIQRISALYVLFCVRQIVPLIRRRSRSCCDVTGGCCAFGGLRAERLTN